MHRNEISTRIGFLTPSALIAAFLVIACVAGITLLFGGVLFSPGALNAQPGPALLGGVAAHAGLRDCAACHPAPWSGQSMSGLCLNCHTDLKDDPKNFHQVMVAQGKQSTCTACHTEHHGADAPLTHMDLREFPHAALGFSLQGHPKMADGSPFLCSGCHTNGYARFDPLVCTTCHTLLKAAFVQGHTAAFGSGCLACHDGIDSYGADFDHQKVAFPLAGKHAALDCARCHNQARSIADLKSAPQACTACHAKDDAHQGGLGQDCAQCHSPAGWDQAKIDHSLTRFPLIGKHQAVECTACHVNRVFKGTAATCIACHAKDDAHQGGLGQDCAQCHSPAGWDQARIDHSLTRFPLTGKHQAVECTSCHVNHVFKGTPATCFACHAKDDAHQGDLGQDCSLCHTTAAWRPSTFDHAKASFPLTGKHQAVECTACHINHVFKGTPATCYACHAKKDAHQGQFGQNCALCHTTSGWLPSTFDHAKTSFQLTGAHIKTACQRCHVSGPNGVVFKGTPNVCSACHADPAYHRGLLGLNCATCHTTTAWTPAKFSLAHTFPINHGGAGGSCRRCHPSTLAQYTCYSCHNQGEMANQHRGRGDISNCVACHATGGGDGGGGGD